MDSNISESLFNLSVLKKLQFKHRDILIIFSPYWYNIHLEICLNYLYIIGSVFFSLFKIIHLEIQIYNPNYIGTIQMIHLEIQNFWIKCLSQLSYISGTIPFPGTTAILLSNPSQKIFQLYFKWVLKGLV